MKEFDDSLFVRVHALTAGLLEGTLAPTERSELESLLASSPPAREAYLAYVQETACLRWLCVEQFPSVVELAPASNVESTSAKFNRRRLAIGALCSGLACLLAIVVVPLSHLYRGEIAKSSDIESAIDAKSAIAAEPIGAANSAKKLMKPGPARATANAVATITALGNARWESAFAGAGILSRCAVGDRLKLRGGSAELTFDAGAQVTVFGPADFEITSATSIRCRRGRVTALVGPRGKGFSIQTPQAKVVDLGTQFGLSISDRGETEVVVFQGSVDLSYGQKATAAEAAARRMQQGEALLLKRSGEIERLVSVQRNRFMGGGKAAGVRPREPVIADVRDNIRKGDSIKSYQIVRGGLDEDVLAFVDRNHQWNGMDAKGMPPFLVGADYIMPFNDDKFVRGLELKVRLLRPADLYVFLDKNMAAPDWLRKDFVDTGLEIGLDGAKTEWHRDHSLGVGPGRSVDFRFSIWKRLIRQAGTVVLGGIEETPQVRSNGFNMYGIAAVSRN
jgi:ferric-dicitrate binding protein FerR (iron transport regulator)